MYEWRKLTPGQRMAVVAARKEHRCPWHRPPHMKGGGWYHLSAACYQHQKILGTSEVRMTGFMELLLGTIDRVLGAESLAAWSILQNHYHVLIIAQTSLTQITKT